MTVTGGQDGKTPEQCFGDLNSCKALEATFPGGSAECNPKKAEDGTISFKIGDNKTVQPNNDHILPETDNIFAGGDCGTSECTETDYGTEGKGIGTDLGKLYNHIYVWTIPIAYNQLTYGNSGNPGAYVSATYNGNIQGGKVYVTLGKGGTNNTNKAEDRNGNATIVKVQDCPPLPDIVKNEDGSEAVVTPTNVKTELKEIINAAGGLAGDSNKNTNGFDMCFKQFDVKDKFAFDHNPNEYTCARNDGKTFCCMGDQATNTTRDILDNSIKYSKFDEKGAETNDSSIIGLGLGRGAMGIGSTTYNEELVYYKALANISTSQKYNGDKVILHVPSPNYDGKGAKSEEHYKNYILPPAPLNGYAGGGAVIIEW